MIIIIDKRSLPNNCDGCILERRVGGWYPVILHKCGGKKCGEVCFTTSSDLSLPFGVTFMPYEQSFSVKEWLE